MADAPPRPRAISADMFHEAMVAAGVVRAGELIQRLVVDAQVGHAVVVHVQRVGDERLLDVALSLAGVEVREGPAGG